MKLCLKSLATYLLIGLFVFPDVQAQEPLPYSVVEVVIDNLPRNIAFLGEDHIKNQDLAAQEKALINSYSFRLLEGYAGNGRDLTMVEASLALLVNFVRPLFQKARQLESSSIQRAMAQGFMSTPDGSIWFGYCYLGVTTAQGFFVNQVGIQDIVRGAGPEQIGRFFRGLKVYTEQVSRTRQILNADRLVFQSWEISTLRCQNKLNLSAENLVQNAAIEIGDLAIWDSEKTCGDMICNSEKSSRPSSRDLRMMDNIYAHFQANRELTSGIVVVGKAHLPALKALLLDWPHKRRYYLR
jgi:hypothetical protein